MSDNRSDDGSDDGSDDRSRHRRRHRLIEHPFEPGDLLIGVLLEPRLQ